MYYMSINKNLSGTHNTNPSHKKKNTHTQKSLKRLIMFMCIGDLQQWEKMVETPTFSKKPQVHSKNEINSF